VEGSQLSAEDLRAIAFYLPQFHRIDENDRWWGKGFTEWTNVRRGRPQFAGHYQPHTPGELGYYDLLDPAVRGAQAALAREHGIHGFCYYHYWFNGRRLLERPLDAVMASGTPDLPFCVCWANENWTRRWDGLEDDILVQQVYSLRDSRAFLESLLPLFHDPRYIRVDDRPLLLVYKAALIPNVAGTAAVWRDGARAAGLAGLHLVACETTGETDPIPLGFDAGCEFPPHGHRAVPLNGEMRSVARAFRGMVTSYKGQVVQSLQRGLPEFPLYRTVMPGWDNTARRQDGGTIFVGSSPQLFGYWVERMAAQTREQHTGDARLMFVNAWNEWGEGCHLEPDARYGRQYLQALAQGLRVQP
jgi:lipopolysaccharide biosynthesis protein